MAPFLSNSSNSSVMGKESTLYWIRNICPLKCPSSHKSSKCYRYVKQERVRKGAMPLESPLSRNGSGLKEKRKLDPVVNDFSQDRKMMPRPTRLHKMNGRLTRFQLWHSFRALLLLKGRRTTTICLTQD